MQISARNITVLLAVSALAVSNLLVFGPINIYLANYDQFSIGLLPVLPSMAAVAAAMIVLLAAPGLVMKDRARGIYVSLLLGFGILLWFQGNILAWDYGLLDGSEIDWDALRWRGYIDTAVWAAVLAACAVFHTKITKRAALLSLVLTGVMAVNVVAVVVTDRDCLAGIDRRPADPRPEDAIYRFSPERNVVHLILDAMESDIFLALVKEDPDYYKSTLEGFTFFKECSGTFSSTVMSTARVVSEEVYNNQLPLKEYFGKLGRDNTVPGVLNRNGFDVDLVASSNIVDNVFAEMSFARRFAITMPEQNDPLLVQAYLTDLALFRLLPHFVKRIVNNNQSWLLYDMLIGENKFQPVVYTAFYRDFMERMSADAPNPAYKLLYTWPPHAPLVFDNDCDCSGEALPVNRDNIMRASRCEVKELSKFLERLRALGIYDSSLIIIHGDHGSRTQVDTRLLYTSDEENRLEMKDGLFARIVGEATPMLLVKPPYSNGPMVVSGAQVSLADIPATVASITGVPDDFSGVSVFDVDPSATRERRFVRHGWYPMRIRDGYLKNMTEYSITGSLFDKSSWRQIKVYPGSDGRGNEDEAK